MTDDDIDDDIDPTELLVTRSAAFDYAMKRGQNIAQSRPSDMGWVNGKWTDIPVDPTALPYIAHQQQWTLRYWRLHQRHGFFFWKEE